MEGCEPAEFLWTQNPAPGVGRVCAAQCLVLSCLIRASCRADTPRWGGRLRCWRYALRSAVMKLQMNALLGAQPDQLRDQRANRANRGKLSTHPAPWVQWAAGVGWAGGGPGGPSWSQGHLVRWARWAVGHAVAVAGGSGGGGGGGAWRASPTGASASSFAPSPCKRLAPR
jgi:hypothetical protein